jgi:hypothetical protein
MHSFANVDLVLELLWSCKTAEKADHTLESRESVAFSIAQYAALRPTLWHLTHSNNLDLIRKSRVLMSAELLAHAAPASPRRDRQITPGKPVLRDQKLLHEKCTAFEKGFSMDGLLKELGRRVFFWSGWADRPIKPGRDAISTYAASDVIIRIPLLDVAEAHKPYFSRCNSGATRMQQGKPVPRGPSTFLEAIQCDFPPSKVVEVTFIHSVKLPQSAEVARSLAGPWEAL